MLVLRSRHHWRGIFSTAFSTSADVLASPSNRPIVFNSLTGTRDALPEPPPDQRHLGWYACGPTVYDDAHLGHARTYICFDAIRRILEDHFGIPLLYTIGVTDIDDKILRRAMEDGISPREVAQLYEKRFFEDMAALGVREPMTRLRVSDHMEHIVRYIEVIISNGMGYVTPSGVYFDVNAFGEENYGQLGPLVASSSSPEGRNLRPSVGADVEHDGDAEGTDTTTVLSDKRDARDFALWKSVSAAEMEAGSEGEAFWDSPWGKGRPGWHIECSALTHSMYGPPRAVGAFSKHGVEQLHIHSGGRDLAFPHHCNEIAQCEAFRGRPGGGWVELWMHTGHLYIKGRKMSKSLKNFITVRDLLEDRGVHPDDLRLFCLRYHYRSDIHFSDERLTEATSMRRKLQRFVERVAEYASSNSSSLHTSDPEQDTATRAWGTAEQSLFEALAIASGDVRAAFADDFDTASALQVVSNLAGIGEQHIIAHERRQKEHQKVQRLSPPLLAVADYIVKTTDLLGIASVGAACRGATSVSDLTNGGGLSDARIERDEATMEVLLDYRHEIRNLAKAALKDIKLQRKCLSETKKDGSDGLKKNDETVAALDGAASIAQRLLELSDSLRDDVLPTRLGVKVEDRADGSSHYAFQEGAGALSTSHQREGSNGAHVK